MGVKSEDLGIDGEEKFRTINIPNFTEEEYEILYRLRGPNKTWHDFFIEMAQEAAKEVDDEHLAELIEDYNKNR